MKTSTKSKVTEVSPQLRELVVALEKAAAANGVTTVFCSGSAHNSEEGVKLTTARDRLNRKLRRLEIDARRWRSQVRSSQRPLLY